jgi:FkbM family methyltransferase
MIFDVGMHNGDDTAYYLSQGHSVIAVEADPSLAESGRNRFREEIKSGRLTILNVGISDSDATATFWICDGHSVWNSFDRTIANRNGMTHHPVTIRTRRFAGIIEEFGTPEYLKIDIEGYDSLVIRDLGQAKELPRFISAEAECVGLDDPSNDVIDELHRLCYEKFKLVRQSDFVTLVWPPPPRFLKFVERVGDSAALGRLRRIPGGALLRVLSPHYRLGRRNHGYDFPVGSSGPWGEGTLGKWMSYEEATEAYSAYRQRHFSENPDAPDYSFWCDWHVKL